MDEQLLLIRLADEAQSRGDDEHSSSDSSHKPLLVKPALMRGCSTVAENLPAEAAEWNLSNLLIDGQPVQRSTVIRWLNVCCINVHHVLFDPDIRYGSLVSATELFELLAFADSVGSGRGIIEACLTENQLMKMYLNVTFIPGLQEDAQPQQQHVLEVPHMQQQQQQQEDDMDLQWQQEEQQQQADWKQTLQHHQEPVTVAVFLDGSEYCLAGQFRDNDWDYHLYRGSRSIRAMTHTARKVFSAEVAAQTEQLLYIAHKLQLRELVQLLMDFAAAASVTEIALTPDAEPLLGGISLDTVFRCVWSLTFATLNCTH
jgi:hypothetical protein